MDLRSRAENSDLHPYRLQFAQRVRLPFADERAVGKNLHAKLLLPGIPGYLKKIRAGKNFPSREVHDKAMMRLQLVYDIFYCIRGEFGPVFFNDIAVRTAQIAMAGQFEEGVYRNSVFNGEAADRHVMTIIAL